jgi:hypothetical protein
MEMTGAERPGLAAWIGERRAIGSFASTPQDEAFFDN